MFPAGVLGFANCYRYKLARFCPEDGRKSPFFTLRSVDQSVNFPLIHPSSLSLDYRFHAIIDAAIDRNVQKVIRAQHRQAANPINLYGATKLCSDKLFVAANGYSGHHETRFSVVRYGNVMGSRGSVIPFFLQMRPTGVLPITDPKMTRFWITLEEAVKFVLNCFHRMEGGEIFVPKIPSMNIVDLARAIAPECRLDIVGVRPGEKLHETMVPEDDARNTVEYDDCFVIRSKSVNGNGHANGNNGKTCPEGFRYSSDSNPRWLTVAELQQLVNCHD